MDRDVDDVKIAAVVRRVVCERLGVGGEMNLEGSERLMDDLGLDSFSVVSLISRLQSELGLSIPEAAVTREAVQSIDSLVSLVKEARTKVGSASRSDAAPPCKRVDQAVDDL